MRRPPLLQNEEFSPGSVWFVGAGPGDPDLLTRKAERLIGKATVIFYDALVGPGVLALIPQNIRKVPVGKRAGRHSKNQKTINDLLVEAALSEEKVLRLKGGDPAIFGRLQEEMDALDGFAIPFHICPGISAASAAAASAGRSLTLRGFARKLTLITAHARAGEELDLDWAALADPDATLAIYMGRSSAPRICNQLLDHHLPEDLPVLLVENASLDDERILRTRLGSLSLIATISKSTNPMVMLIGKAVGVNKKEIGNRTDASLSLVNG